MQLVTDIFGCFSATNLIDPGQRVPLMFFSHKFVACVFIHLIFHSFFCNIVIFLMTIFVDCTFQLLAAVL